MVCLATFRERPVKIARLMPTCLRRAYCLVCGDVPLVLLTALLGFRRWLAILRGGVQNLAESTWSRGWSSSSACFCAPFLLRTQLIVRARFGWLLARRPALWTAPATTAPLRLW